MQLREKIKIAPNLPGVYRFLDMRGKILYVGKAKNLKQRLNDYLGTHLPVHIKSMIGRAYDVIWYVTETEKQALFLEAESIEHLKPIYNIQYRYGKKYSYLHFSKSVFPRVYYDYTWSQDAFGPFEAGYNVKQVVESVCSVFKLRTCTDAVFKRRKRPCLEYDLGRCSAPCVNFVNQEQYQYDVKDLYQFFGTGDDKILGKYRKGMEEASDNAEFELAQIYYQRLKGLEGLRSLVTSEVEMDFADFFISNHDGNNKCVHILGIRNKKLKYKFCIVCERSETMDGFIARWHVKNKLTENIYVNEPVSSELQQVLYDKGLQVRMYRFEFEKINDLIAKIIEENKQVLVKYTKQQNLIAKIKQELQLETLEKVEIYDNSHMAGKWNLGVKVVWDAKEGFIKRDYQKFTFEERTNDDYKMMRQMFKRRFAQDDVFPDLVIIDGGAGQYSVSTDLIPVPHYALSKHQEGDKLHGKDGLIEISQDVRLWLMRLRDEAHRFAVASHTALKTKSMEED